MDAHNIPNPSSSFKEGLVEGIIFSFGFSSSLQSHHYVLGLEEESIEIILKASMEIDSQASRISSRSSVEYLLMLRLLPEQKY
jgi:hypothetical protein